MIFMIFTWNNVNIRNKYFELQMKDQIKKRSSQLVCNLSSCEKKAWKKNQAFFLQLLKMHANCEDLSSIWFMIFVAMNQIKANVNNPLLFRYLNYYWEITQRMLIKWKKFTKKNVFIHTTGNVCLMRWFVLK